MAKDQVKAAYVLGKDTVGNSKGIFLQIPADNQWGFAICDDEQSWAGGIGSGLASWEQLSKNDPRINAGDRDRLEWILEENEEPEPTLEVCANTEWVREHCLDQRGIDEADVDEAADYLAASVLVRLQEAGFTANWSSGDRSTYHGWNGARFKSKIDLVGCFGDLDTEQAGAVYAAIEQAKKETRDKCADLHDYSFRTDAELGVITAVDFDDACEQLREMLPAAALADGAWGWVEDLDGERFEVGIQPGKVAGL